MTTDTLDKPLPPRRALLLAIVAAIAILVADQLSKYLVVVVMNLRETGEVHVFPGLNFRMAWNTGVNFGLLSGGGDATRYVLAGGAGLASIGLIIGAMFSRRMLSALGLGIAAGGAIGNAIDRFNWGGGGRLHQPVLLRDTQPVVLQRGRHRNICGVRLPASPYVPPADA